MTISYYAGIFVPLEESSVCAFDGSGKIVREGKVPSEPKALIAWFRSLGVEFARIGLEAGPTSQWLYGGMQQAGLAVELVETRHVRNAFKIMPVKMERNDARGIAELIRLRGGSALQVDGGSGDASHADRAQAGAEKFVTQ